MSSVRCVLALLALCAAAIHGQDAGASLSREEREQQWSDVDLYDALELQGPTGAAETNPITAADILKSFRRLSKIAKKDPTSEGRSHLARLEDAFAILGDAMLREDYDAFKARPPQSNATVVSITVLCVFLGLVSLLQKTSGVRDHKARLASDEYRRAKRELSGGDLTTFVNEEDAKYTTSWTGTLVFQLPLLPIILARWVVASRAAAQADTAAKRVKQGKKAAAQAALDASNAEKEKKKEERREKQRELATAKEAERAAQVFHTRRREWLDQADGTELARIGKACSYPALADAAVAGSKLALMRLLKEDEEVGNVGEGHSLSLLWRDRL